MTTPTGILPRYRDLVDRAGAPDHSSWGLWGDTDTLGTLNLLTPGAVQRALATATEGQVVSLNASLTAFQPPLFGREPLVHEVGEFSDGRIRDETLSGLNTQASSQWDGFRHVRHAEHGFYNGLPESAISMSDWAERGIVGRGVLLDAERWFVEAGRPIDQTAAHGIDVDDLDAMIDALPQPLEVGDVLVLHTGWLGHRIGHPDPSGGSFRSPGLVPSRDMLARLWDTHCAAMVSDNPSLEVWPPGACAAPEVKAEARRTGRDDPRVFMHYELIALLGLAVGELWDTRALVETARRLDRTTFLLTAAPLNVDRGVASPANALAIF